MVCQNSILKIAQKTGQDAYHVCATNPRGTPRAHVYQDSRTDPNALTLKRRSMTQCYRQQQFHEQGGGGSAGRKCRPEGTMLGLAEHNHRHAHRHGSASNLLPTEANPEEKSWAQSYRLRHEYGNVSSGWSVTSLCSNKSCLGV